MPKNVYNSYGNSNIYINRANAALRESREATAIAAQLSLNSVDTITNNLGVVEARMAYKPFGEKLNLDKDGKTTQKAPHTNRGYTGHEHIEESNLIHMNARLYDPSIARFLSADYPNPKKTKF